MSRRGCSLPANASGFEPHHASIISCFGQVSDALLELRPGEITYVYKIWDVTFADVEAVGVALRDSHVHIVDYRELPRLVREKRAWLEGTNS
jgi:hypothetical protein